MQEVYYGVQEKTEVAIKWPTELPPPESIQPVLRDSERAHKFKLKSEIFNKKLVRMLLDDCRWAKKGIVVKPPIIS